ncbi:MAG: calcium channel protein [Watsoniomyces obsoletus]|nr:MAG: calcium channel protein [Watsoniomyces obsoletus]
MPPIKKTRGSKEGKEAGARGRGRGKKRSSPEPQGGGGKRRPAPKKVGGGGGRAVMAQANAQAAEMTEFYQELKKKREAERAHAIANDLVDDPNKQRRLEDAIIFRGTCEAMCPEFERVERIVQRAVDACEKIPGLDGVEAASQPHMVKRFRRSAAGDEAQLPSDVRTPRTLRRTLDYLMDEVVGGPKRLADVHAFVWDRTRSIRNDFTLQNVEGFENGDLKIAIECYEIIARFHIHVLHEMSRPNQMTMYEFVAYNEREQLNKTLMSLVEFYDIAATRGVESPDEAEFRSYRVVFHLNNPHVEREVQALAEQRPEIYNHPNMQLAMELYELATNSHELQEYPGTPLVFPAKLHQFFERIKEDDVWYTMACMAEIHFNVIRKNALTAMRDNNNNADVSSEYCTLAVLMELFGFDQHAEACEFAEVCGMIFTEDERGCKTLELESGPTPLLDPNQKLLQPFSKKLVECKRDGLTLPEAIHGGVVQNAEGVERDEGQGQDQTAGADDSTTKKTTATGMTTVETAAAALPSTVPPEASPQPGKQEDNDSLFIPHKGSPSPAQGTINNPFVDDSPENSAPPAIQLGPTVPSPPASGGTSPPPPPARRGTSPPPPPASQGTSPPPAPSQRPSFPLFVPRGPTQSFFGPPASSAPPASLEQPSFPSFVPRGPRESFFAPRTTSAPPATSEQPSFSLFVPPEATPAPAKPSEHTTPPPPAPREATPPPPIVPQEPMILVPTASEEPAPPPLPELPRNVVSFITTNEGGLLNELIREILPGIVRGAEAEHNEEVAREFRRNSLIKRYGGPWKYRAKESLADQRRLRVQGRMREMRLWWQQQQREQEETKKRKSETDSEETMAQMARAKRRREEREVAMEVARRHEEKQKQEQEKEKLRLKMLATAKGKGPSPSNGEKAKGTSSPTSRPQYQNPPSSKQSLRKRMKALKPPRSGRSIIDNAIAQGIPREIAEAIANMDTVQSDFWRLKAAGLEKLPNGVVQPIGMPGGGGSVPSSRPQSRHTSTTTSSARPTSSSARPSSAGVTAAAAPPKPGARKRSFEDFSRPSSHEFTKTNTNNDAEATRPSKKTSIQRSTELLSNGISPSTGTNTSNGGNSSTHIPVAPSNLPPPVTTSTSTIPPSHITTNDNDQGDEEKMKKTKEDEEEAALFAKVRALNKAMDEDIVFYREEVQKEELRRRRSSGESSQLTGNSNGGDNGNGNGSGNGKAAGLIQGGNKKVEMNMVTKKKKKSKKEEDENWGLSERQIEWLAKRKAEGNAYGYGRRRS